MALQETGPISITDIQREVGFTPGTSIGVAGGTTPVAGTLFGNATGVINKAAPHQISEFYGYKQTAPFVMTTGSFGVANDACIYGDTAGGLGDDLDEYYWSGSNGNYPQIGDTIFSDATGDTIVNGNFNWYWILTEDTTIRINTSGQVISKQACNETVSISPATLTTGSAAGQLQVTIASNTFWTLSDNQSWISSSTTSGTGNATPVFNYSEYTGSTSRVATITVNTGLVSDTVVFTQQSGSVVTEFVLNLGYDVSTSTGACNDLTPSAVIADNAVFSSATDLKNALGGAPSPAGYYESESLWRYWNGSSFTTSGLCGI